jgi:hypothetical protein
MKRLLLPTLILFSVTVSAQTSEKFSLEWTNGLVVFKTGDTLRCDLRFNQTGALPILQISRDAHVLTIPTKDVKLFSFFDDNRNRTRTFTTFADNQRSETEYFMERIYADNHFSILNRKTMEVPQELNFSRFFGKPIRTYKKYLLNESTGELLPLTRESLLHLLEPKRTEILSFVKTEHIRFRRISDFIRVFEFHNSL